MNSEDTGKFLQQQKITTERLKKSIFSLHMHFLALEFTDILASNSLLVSLSMESFFVHGSSRGWSFWVHKKLWQLFGSSSLVSFFKSRLIPVESL
jgi:hypothetical protein